MTRLEKILAPYEVVGELGRDRPYDRQYLRSALKAANRQTSTAFWLAVAVQLGVFLLATWFAVRNAANPKVLAFILAGGGSGIGACGLAMVRLWREKVTTDLTLALVSSLNEAAALSVLNVVLDTFRRERSSGSSPAQRTGGHPC
jgi:hypothetical protein